MFKLESYVTPLILSYVDKYIKNLKPEDSQLSLWGGDAVFCNLDLRLDVLEQELQLPFTFVNGHIHELRIHVPWTKLGSEPVVITINTIECILKLRGESASGDSGTQQPNKTCKNESRKHSRKKEITEAPPGYVQSLINRVISNISVVCNNLILKYVEDDIVLSLNIKSAELFSVNEKWERAFVDVNLQEIIIRKIVSMQDLTVCLDKRDASGKIETYQDPLLYRCCTVWRIYSVYNSPHSKYPSVTHINMFCDRLDFSLTDQQLPMFVRLLKLCLALYYKEVELPSEGNVSEESNENRTSGNDQEAGEDDVNFYDESWGSWAWSFVPQMLPLWDEGLESEYTEMETDQQKLNKILQFGIFIEKASCVFKLTEIMQDTLCYGTPKFAFSPLAVLHQYGCCMEMTLRGKDFVNVQLGVTGATISGLGDCLCGYKDFSDHSSKIEKTFLKAGIPPGGDHKYSYFSSSLFDESAPENYSQRRVFCFDQEEHLSQLTEEVMVKRFPAFAFDYIYELEIPKEWTDKSSSITSTFLEESNWHETAVCRVVIGPFCADITSSMVHRLSKFIFCAEDHDYPPYSKAKSRKQSLNDIEVSEEDIENLESFVPTRSYHLTLFKPVLRLSVADHPRYDAHLKPEINKVRKRSKKLEKYVSMPKPYCQPVLFVEVSADCVDLQANVPMYPHRVNRFVSSLPSPSENLVYHCYSHNSLKLFGLEAALFGNQSSHQTGSVIIPQSSITFFKKNLLFPDYWKEHPHSCLQEYWCECSHLTFHLTEPQVVALLCIYQSWIAKDFNSSALTGSSLTKDILEQGRPKLCTEVNGLEFCSVITKSVASYKGTAMSAYVKLQNAEHSAVLFSAPECTRDVPRGLLFEKSTQKDQQDEDSNSSPVSEVWFKAFLQIPEDLNSSEPLVLAIQMSGVAVCLDPALLTWLSYETPRFRTDSTSFIICSPTTFQEVDGESSGSTQTPAASGSASLSKAPASVCSDSVSLCDSVEQLLVDYYSRLKYLIIQVEIQSCCVLFPVSPWLVNVEEKIPLVASWKKAFNSGLLGAACMLCFPHITVHNSCTTLDQQLSIFSMDLPLSNIKGMPKEQEHFPWTLSVDEFSLYTVDNTQQKQQKNVFFVLNPSSASVTIAVSSKANQKQLGLCIHVDTKALNFGCSASQVNLMVTCLNILLNCSKFFHFMKSWIEYFEQKPFHLNDNRNPIISQPANNDPNISNQQLQTGDNAEKIKITSEEGTTEKNYDCDSHSQPNRKITLWIQLTLSKLTFNLYGNLTHIDSRDGFHFQFDTEEVITSLDIQEVYSKMKVKLSSLNVNCFLRWPGDSTWYPGPYEGIVLCSSNKLPPSLKTSTNNFSSSNSHSSAKVDNQPFLLATYTKALCTNAKKKWVEDLKHEVPADDDVEKYISEIDIKVKPIDIILWLPLFKIIHQICHPLLNLNLVKSLQVQKPRASSDEPKLIGFSNKNLPLLYVKTSSLRMFLPKSYFGSSDKTGTPGILEDSPSYVLKGKPDMLLLQCSHVTLSSQVENPLSRIILQPDLYSAAQSSKTIGLPGSDIEDRQYQLDICELSFGSVVSQDVAKRSKHKQEASISHPLIMGENPALEWNTGVVNETRKLGNPDPVPVIPIMSSFDLRVAVAPAIVCKHPSYHDSSKVFVVAGISSEISVAGDICIYLSIQRMHLLCSVLEKNFCVGSPSETGSLCSSTYPSSLLKGALPEIPRDSGIESETSTLLHSSSMTSDSQKLKSSVDGNSDISDDFVPFEILITAGSIALMVFAHKDDLILDKCEMKSELVKHHRSLRAKNKLEKHSNTENRYSSVNEDALSGKWTECLNSRKHKKRKAKKNSLHAPSYLVSSAASSSKSKSDMCPDATTSASSCEKEEDGYEGSSDSSESEISVGESFKKETGKLFPFLMISVSQPHSFIQCHPASQKFETSCFDLQFCGSRSFHFVSAAEDYCTPLLSDFTQPYLETKPGDCDPKTGIPPALYTLTCTDFLHEPAKIKLRVERPVKCHLSPSMWSNINLFLKSFQVKMVDTVLGPSAPKVNTVPEDISKDQQSALSTLLKYLCHIGSLDVSTVQVVLEVDVPKPKNILVSLILDRIETAVKADSLFGNAEKVKMCVKIFGAVLKTSAWGQSWPIIHPLTASVTATCQLKPWKQVKVIFSGETVFINCGSRYFLSLQAFVNYLQELIQNFGMASSEAELQQTHLNNCSKSDKKEVKPNKKQYSKDDLRKGSFQFIQDSGRQNQQPEAYEIIFCKGFGSEPATMTWRYPEPRILTKVDVSPVPFQSSVDKDHWNQFSENNNYEIICHIQYWDSLRNEFINLCNFKLSETVPCSMDLSNLDNDALAVSEVWRALLDYEFERDDCATFEDTEDTYLSPLALAACMCVDSCFDVDSIPLVQLMASFELLKFSFYNYFPETGSTPNLYPFAFDGTAPANQEFMILSADNTSLSFDKWASKWRLQSCFKISTDVLEYRCLTMMPFIDPFDVHINVVTHDTEKYPVIEADVALSRCFLNLSQSVIHTLHYSSHSWVKDLSPPSLSKYCVEYMLPNYYIVCNKTQEKIRFGQVNTDESIILASHKMHAYSWRSHKTQQTLRVCLESSRWKWSQPFDIDSVGTRIIAVDSSTTLILVVKSISNLQKQIIIDGHLIIANRLNYPVHMKLSSPCSTSHGQDSKAYLKTVKTLVPSKSCTASFILHQKYPKGLHLSLTKTADSLVWSDDIDISKSSGNQLIKIPWETQNQFQNVWCQIVKRSVLGDTVTVVFLCPVFLIRNHLPRPLVTNVEPLEQGQGYSMEIDGRGEEHQIFVESDWESSVQLSFQMHSGMKISNPPLTIRASDADQFCSKTCLDSENLEELYNEWKSSHYVSWPYSHFEMQPETITQKDTMYHCVSSLSTFPAIKSCEAPNTELKVQLSQRWSGFNTVLVDVKPWALFINRLDIELFLIECGGREWKLAPNSSFVPPTLGEHFKLGFQLDDELSTSIPLSLQQNNKTVPQTHKKGLIPLNGCIKVLIQVEMETSKVLIFQLKSEVKEEIRILVALPLLSVMNSSEMDLYSCLFITPSLPNKVFFQQKELTKTMMIKNISDVQPLLFWEISTPFQLQEIGDDLLDLFFYVSLSVYGPNENEWSYPVCLSPDLPDDIRHSLAVPTSSGTSTPCVITSHRRHDLTFLILSKDPSPMFHLYNKTSVSLFYGQSCSDSEDCTVYEEKATFCFFPFISPGSSVHYTFPVVQNKFPVPSDVCPMLHLALKSDDNEKHGPIWSTPINTSLDNQFVLIPDACDVRISKERTGHTINLYIEPVNRIELSAKEIRSRIALATQSAPSVKKAVSNAGEASKAENVTGPSTVCRSKIKVPAKKMQSEINKSPKASGDDCSIPCALYFSLHSAHISVVICDELKSESRNIEVVRLNVDNALFFTRPQTESHSGSKSNKRNLLHEITICFGHIQLDNQMDRNGKTVYDFPVVFQGYSDSKQKKKSVEVDNAYLPNKVKDNALLVIDITVEVPLHGGKQLLVKRADVVLQPVALCLEDTLYYQLVELYKSYIPLSFHKHRPSWKNIYLPKDVLAVASSLKHPLNFEHLKIDIKEVFLSIHASLKLYLSLEHSLLRVPPFERVELFTNSYQLGRIIVFHYLTGALLRAGWVVGSLDLLGNPAGFARAVGTGVMDFVLLPYRGLLNGPRAFITGLSHGAAALFTQISSGALTCVTNLAASVSRNMDFLSFDADHLARQELLRRQLPHGVAGGLLQGLSGFGISLLGAIAGIVDHPLQVLVSPSTPVSTATGIVSGLGKGLVGVFTKPIGGAAELVSQTGFGLLHGAGWLSVPIRQHEPLNAAFAERLSSDLKFACKLVPSSALGEILLCLPASHVNENGQYEGNILILTSEVLSVVSTDEDNQQRTFALTEVKCQKSDSDHSTLIIIPESVIDEETFQENAQSKARVVEYVQRSCFYENLDPFRSESHPEETAVGLSMKSKSVFSHAFFVQPKYRNVFFTTFHSAKRKVMGKGFLV